MNIKEKIKKYIESQTEPKQADINALHQLILLALPKCKLWFLDGKDDKGKIVSNPNIGYGLQTIKYADGKTKAFYQIGISANTTGISVYIMGIEDKKYLPETYGKTIGKASVTGYCIKFKRLQDIDINTLETAIKDGVEKTTLLKTISTTKGKNTKQIFKTPGKMTQQNAVKLKNGDNCIVIGGTHKGKAGTVQDLNTSKTGHITITVMQKNGVRFKTLGKNVILEQ